MYQRLRSQVVVDERRRSSERPDGKCQEKKCRSIHEVQSHNLSCHNLVRVRQPSCISEYRVVELLECPAFPFKDEEDLIATLCILGVLLELVEQVYPVRLSPFLEVPLDRGDMSKEADVLGELEFRIEVGTCCNGRSCCREKRNCLCQPRLIDSILRLIPAIFNVLSRE